MKKIIILLFGLLLLLTGCDKYNKSNIIKEVNNKIDKGSGYYVSGILSVYNNDENYNYNVKVFYKKDNYYKVELTNTDNNHTQVILKNKKGVYVITPALNKSFRFNSDWPYNNSQIYLIDALIGDIKRDKDNKFSKNNNNYNFETSVKYPNNSKLDKQKIVFDSKLKPKSVIVYTNDGIVAMKMIFKKVRYINKLKEKDFDISEIVSEKEVDSTEGVGNLEDVIYPLYIPDGTKLVGEERVKKDNGERVIMNYDGEKSFMLVEETADVFREFTVIPTLGEPYQLMDTLGVVKEKSLSWTSSGVDFYLVSEVMSQDEMIEVAQSISGIVSIK